MESDANTSETSTVSLNLERHYDLKDLWEQANAVPGLLESFGFLENENSEKLREGCLDLLEKELTLREYCLLYVAAARLYFVDANAWNVEERRYLLQRVAHIFDDPNPIPLHFIAKQLYEGLKLCDEHNFNLLSICTQLALFNHTSRTIAMSLVWAILRSMYGFDINFFRLFKLEDLVEIVHTITAKHTKESAELRKMLIIMKCVAFLLNNIVHRDSTYLKENGYAPFFQYEREDVKDVFKWAQDMAEVYELNHPDMINSPFYRKITHVLHYCILNPLEDNFTEQELQEVHKTNPDVII